MVYGVAPWFALDSVTDNADVFFGILHCFVKLVLDIKGSFVICKLQKRVTLLAFYFISPSLVIC